MSPVFAAARERLVRKPLDCLAPMRGFRSSSSRGWWCRAGGSFACVGALVPRETVRTVDVDGTRLHYHPIATQVLITLRNSCRMAVFATDRDAILNGKAEILGQGSESSCCGPMLRAAGSSDSSRIVSDCDWNANFDFDRRRGIHRRRCRRLPTPSTKSRQNK